MLIGERNGLLSGLPYDAEVEYLESTGTQWIDTGCPISLDTIYQIKVRSLPNSADNTILAAYASYNPDYSNFSLIMRIQRYLEGAINVNSFGGGTIITQSTEPVEIEFAKNYYSLNGGSRVYFSTSSNTVPPYQLGTTLFAIRSTPTRLVNFAEDTRMYYFKQIGGEQLLRDLIPVRIGTEGAMYDLRGVGGMNPDGSARNDGLYRNRGTGAFVIGPDKVSSAGGGYKPQCVRRLYRRSLRLSARFWRTPLWKEVA